MDGDDLMAINMGEAITVERSQKKPSWTPMGFVILRCAVAA